MVALYKTTSDAHVPTTPTRRRRFLSEAPVQVMFDNNLARPPYLGASYMFY